MSELIETTSKKTPSLSEIYHVVQNIKKQLQTNLEKLDDFRGDLKITIDYDYFEKFASEQIDEIMENEKKNIQDVTQLQIMIYEFQEKITKMTEESEAWLQRIKEKGIIDEKLYNEEKKLSEEIEIKYHIEPGDQLQNEIIDPIKIDPIQIHIDKLKKNVDDIDSCIFNLRNILKKPEEKKSVVDYDEEYDKEQMKKYEKWSQYLTPEQLEEESWKGLLNFWKKSFVEKKRNLDNNEGYKNYQD
jgi:hypothetical protein